VGTEAEVPKPVFTNTLGMQFIPVAGTPVLMCIHETRNQDYKACAAAVKGVNPSPIFSDKSAVDQAGDHPIRNVRYLDAAGFCEWLSKKEGRKYRLPTDEEWSLAMGIGPAENRVAGDTPETLSRRPIQEFPWGSRQWPPPVGFGNYGDTTWKAAFPNEVKFIEGYTDGFPTTAPVMSFPPNRQGLYDMSGNVTEWVQDWWNAEQKDRTYRGGGYGNREPRDLQPSSRGHHAPAASYSNGNQGFRCVVEK
jgi:formylglycine-generating enzyme required for sulfatase activity